MPFEFENWAVIALGGIPNKVQVGDMGVDGRIFPVSSSAAPRKQQEGELGLKERWHPIQVKQKDKAGRPDIDAFEAMMMREDCEKGFFVSFDYTSDALTEADAFFRRNGSGIGKDSRNDSTLVIFKGVLSGRESGFHLGQSVIVLIHLAELFRASNKKCRA